MVRHPESENETLAGLVYSRVRADILAGHLEPGQRIRPSVVAEQYGVSLSVVREALTRLVPQGLVSSAPHQGFRVVSLDPAALVDLTAVRIDIETIALRKAILHGDVSWEAEVIAAQHRLANTPKPDRNAEPVAFSMWTDAHADFHEALVGACGSPLLLGLRRQLFDQAALYRWWSWSSGSGDGPRDVKGEHRALMEAAISRDVETALSCLRDHLQATAQALLTARGTVSVDSARP